MDSKNFDELKEIFSSSNSPDELFDAFSYAIKNKIGSLELYQLFLWNKAICKDEIVMYACKICSVFPEYSYDIYLLVAGIFESYSNSGDDYLMALLYYKKALSVKPDSIPVYLAVAKLYNKDLDAPPFGEVIVVISDGLENVNRKSKLYYALSDLYEKKGDYKLKKEFWLFGDSAAKNEDQ
jgi:hypothetical protein